MVTARNVHGQPVGDNADLPNCLIVPMRYGTVNPGTGTLHGCLDVVAIFENARLNSSMLLNTSSL